MENKEEGCSKQECQTHQCQKSCSDETKKNSKELEAAESGNLLVKKKLEEKERRRNLVPSKTLCFKCKEKPNIAYRNGLVVCK